MFRYLRLYACFLRFSFSRAMEFRFDFFFRIGMDTIWYAINLGFFWVLYRHTPRLGGWNEDQALVFLGGVFVADAVNMTVFSNNMWWLPFAINKGDLDYHLVRPVSSLFFLSLREFAANSFLNLVMAVSIAAWTILRYPEPLGVASVALYVLFLLMGVFLHYSLQMLFLIPTFWMHTAHGLREVFFALDQYTNRPYGIFQGWVRRLLVSVLPFALIVSFPTRTLFEGISPGFALHMTGITAAAFAAMVFLWRRGLRAYASASS
ncbi:MAG: ABC-2 family transporter protein [Planctomycetes bacterium]|nr:ABC-2 family transporter protein [Planctomycetota bacterium]